MTKKVVSLLSTLTLLLGMTAVLASPAAAVEPEHVTITWEGCRGSVTGPNYISTGSSDTPFICADSQYTTGNLGGGWNELDLVPHRLTTELGTQASSTTTFDLRVTGDYLDDGTPGYDFITVPLINEAQSDDSCEIVAGDLETNADDSLVYRDITITQDKGTTCVFEFDYRLAVGASEYPGASLHAHTRNEDGGTQGVGNRDISIPVNEIAPQSIDKTMTASRGADHVWTLEKEATPASITFPNTCDPSNPTVLDVDVVVRWVRHDADPSGDVTIITDVYATNPAHRSITVNVSDQIYEGTTPTTAVGAPAVSGPIAVPANTADYLILHHELTVANDATSFNDVATATYTDTLLGVPVPGNTTAMASADVTVGATTNQTATITDSESITGDFTFSVAAPSVGSFTNYTAGDETTGPVDWSSGEQSGSGEVTFEKSIQVDAGTASSGTLSDTADLTGSDGASATAGASVDVSAAALVDLTVDKSITGGTLDEDITFGFTVTGPNAFSEDVSITIPAGGTTGSVTLNDVEPGSYNVEESDPAGFAKPADESVTIALPDCSGSVSFENTFAPATAEVLKVTDPAGAEEGWEFTLTRPDGTTAVDETDAAGEIDFGQLDQEGTYTVTETEQDGWDLTTDPKVCEFTVDYPADFGEVFSCTFTNVQRGKILVAKSMTTGDFPAGGFEFQLREGASGSAQGDILDTVNITSTTPVQLDGLLPPGTYQVCEFIMPGWDSSIIDEPGAFVPEQGVTLPADLDNSYVCIDVELSAGAEVTVTVTNTPPPGGMAKTIGFWKNHAACKTSNGNQEDFLTPALGAGFLVGDLLVDTCQEAVTLLNKTDLKTRKKAASDPAFNFASQYVAYKLNVASGAETCQAAIDAANAGQAVLDAVGFQGETLKKNLTKQQAADLNTYAGTLDAYNNNDLCS